MDDHSDSLKLAKRRSTRLIYLGLGHLSLGVGIIGIFLPVLPTVPFVLLASICYARGSAKFYHWLMNHRVFGPPLVDWKKTRSLPLRVKALAVTLIAISASVSIFFLIPVTAVKWLVAICCTSVAGYLSFVIPTRKKG